MKAFFTLYNEWKTQLAVHVLFAFSYAGLKHIDAGLILTSLQSYQSYACQSKFQPTQLNPLVLVNSHFYHIFLIFQSIQGYTLLPQIHGGKKTKHFL